MASAMYMPVAAATIRSSKVASRAAFKGQPLKAVSIRATRKEISTVCKAAVRSC